MGSDRLDADIDAFTKMRDWAQERIDRLESLTVPVALDSSVPPAISPESPETVGEWWQRVSAEDFAGAMPKADEYGGSTDGSADLKIIGYALSQLRMPEGTPENVQQQAACWFYELGKVARAITNLNKGESIKPDTAHDGRVYWMMVERLRETGRWP